MESNSKRLTIKKTTAKDDDDDRDAHNNDQLFFLQLMLINILFLEGRIYGRG